MMTPEEWARDMKYRREVREEEGEDMEYGHPITWDYIADLYPEFVAWAVAAYGPLPTGEVQREDYDRLKAGYESREDQL